MFVLVSLHCLNMHFHVTQAAQAKTVFFFVSICLYSRRKTNYMWAEVPRWSTYEIAHFIGFVEIKWNNCQRQLLINDNNAIGRGSMSKSVIHYRTKQTPRLKTPVFIGLTKKIFFFNQYANCRWFWSTSLYAQKTNSQTVSRQKKFFDRRCYFTKSFFTISMLI